MLTYRDDEIDPAGPLSKTLDELIRLRVDQIRLLGLPQTAVAEMIKALSGHEPPPALVNLIYANTEGNPLFVEELIRHLDRSGSNGDPLESIDQTELDLPHSLRLVIGRRLMRVSKETQKILGTAAVIGRSFTFALLEAATHVEADRLVELVEEAEKTGLILSRLRYPDAQFKFGHELIRRAVLDNLSIARRQRLHLSVAEAIELLYPNALRGPCRRPCPSPMECRNSGGDRQNHPLFADCRGESRANCGQCRGHWPFPESSSAGQLSAGLSRAGPDRAYVAGHARRPLVYDERIWVARGRGGLRPSAVPLQAGRRSSSAVSRAVGYVAVSYRSCRAHNCA